MNGFQSKRTLYSLLCKFVCLTILQKLKSISIRVGHVSKMYRAYSHDIMQLCVGDNGYGPSDSSLKKIRSRCLISWSTG